MQGNWGTMDRFNNAFVNTTMITIVCVLLETILGVAMALIMSKAFRGRGVVRAGILVPWAIPTIVSALMWKLIFDEAGVANRILGQQILWLADTGASFWAIVIADVWKTAPFIGLLTLAGLQTIPAEVYEAAKVDGATAVQQFIRITLPMVKPTLVVAVLFRTLDTMRMFDLPYGMIGPGKYRVETLSVFAYQEASQSRYGPAAAYSIILFIYVLLVAFLFVKVIGADVVGENAPTKKEEEEGRSRSGVRNVRGNDGRGALMSTTTTGPVESHTSAAEVAELARKPSSAARVGMVASYLGMAFIVIYCILPFYWMLVSSLRTPRRRSQHLFIPSPASLENYQGVFSGNNMFGRALINSVIIAGSSTILTLIFGIVAAYACGAAELQGQGLCAGPDHRLLDVSPRSCSWCPC